MTTDESLLILHVEDNPDHARLGCNRYLASGGRWRAPRPLPFALGEGKS